MGTGWVGRCHCVARGITGTKAVGRNCMEKYLSRMVKTVTEAKDFIPD